MTFLRRYTSVFVLAGLAAAAIAAVAIIIHATHTAPWAFSDATAYLWTANNLAAGKGLVLQNTDGSFSPLTWHPPLFPLLLSLPAMFGADLIQASRWLNAFCFGGTVFICGLATWRFTRSIPAALGVTLLSLTAIDLIFTFSGIMSEGLYFFLGFCALFFLVEGLREAFKPKCLLAAGFLAGLSYLARYTGIVFIFTVIGVAILYVPGNVFWRIRKTLPVSLPAVVIPALFSLWVFSYNRTFGGRNLQPWDGLRKDFSIYFDRFEDVIVNWFPYMLRGNHIIPVAAKIWLGMALILAVLFLSLWLIRKHGPVPGSRGRLLWLTSIGTFTLAYIGFHLASFVFSSAAPAIDQRLLSPLLLGVILIMGSVFSLASHAGKRTWILEWMFVAYTFVSLFYFQAKLDSYLFRQYQFGYGYTNRKWQDSELIKKVSQLDPAVPVVANENALILFYTGRYPHLLTLKEADIIPLPPGPVYIAMFYQYDDTHYNALERVFQEKYSQQCTVEFEDEDGFICLRQGQ